MTVGMTLVATQLLYFSRLGVGESYWALVPGCCSAASACRR